MDERRRTHGAPRVLGGRQLLRAARSFEIYACWNSDVNDCPDCVSDIKIEDIVKEDFYFKEGWLYRVATW